LAIIRRLVKINQYSSEWWVAEIKTDQMFNIDILEIHQAIAPFRKL
jgi:hypothetical protein